jgi:hypothetical protein
MCRGLIVKKLFYATLVASAFCAGNAAAGVYRLDVTVRSEAGARFSAPWFTFTNLSTAGLQITNVGISNGPPWDDVLNRAAPYDILNPAGGTRTLLEGEESFNDPNNGTTPAIRYGLTSFDPGDIFHFSADPEAANGSSAIIDIRPWLTGDLLKITTTFAGGPTLAGSDWTLEYIDPNASHTADSNQLYRLTLQQAFADPAGTVPEPATWGLMILGLGGVGAVLRRRRVEALAA